MVNSGRGGLYLPPKLRAHHHTSHPRLRGHRQVLAAGRGETEAEGETHFVCSAVESSGTTSGTTSGTNHVQGTRDCGADGGETYFG